MENNNNTNQQPVGNIQPTPVPPEIPSLPGRKFSFEFLKQLNPKQKKLTIIGGGVFLTSVVLLLVAAAVGRGGEVKISPRPTPPAQSFAPADPSFNPSPYTDDPEVLAIESKVGEFEQSVSNASARLQELRTPALDWDVSF